MPRTSRDRPAQAPGLLAERTARSLPGLQICVHASLESAQADWQALEPASDCYIFQTWAWNQAWYAHLGTRSGVRPCIIVVSKGNQPVGLWPLGIHAEHRMKVLSFLGDLVSDYRAPLLARQWGASLAAGALSALWEECLAIVPRVDLIRLDRMPERFEQQPNPMVGLPGAWHAENAYWAPLPDSTATYLEARSRSLRANLRRKQRRLHEQGCYRFTPDHPAEDSERVFAALAQQKSRRWQETGSRDLFAQPGYHAFYQSFLPRPEPGSPPLANLCSLQIDDTIVATQWGLRFRKRYYWILPTHADGPWARYSCGQLLLQAQITWAIEQGFAIFDLTVGDEPYKQSWASERLKLYAWWRAGSLRGHLWLKTTRLRQRLRANATLRSVVRRIRGRQP